LIKRIIWKGTGKGDEGDETSYRNREEERKKAAGRGLRRRLSWSPIKYQFVILLLEHAIAAAPKI
jgi:hypothetical protein